VTQGELIDQVTRELAALEGVPFPDPRWDEADARLRSAARRVHGGELLLEAFDQARVARVSGIG
jgi:hypothetical protein